MTSNTFYSKQYQIKIYVLKLFDHFVNERRLTKLQIPRMKNSSAKDLTGKKFGKLTAIKRVENKGNHAQWLCFCECGGEKIATTGNLLRKSVQSCGCLTLKRGNEDLTGFRSGKLMVVKRLEDKVRKNGEIVPMWLCKCDCGGEKIANSYDLKRNATRSCGCLFSSHLKHGKAGKRPYKTWINMKRRCFDKNANGYKDYGGRGITVCEKWLTFEGFWEDMQHGYSDDLTIERKDVNGNYEPSNCRWATLEEQAVNKRNNHPICIDGVTRLLSEWSKITGISVQTILSREKRYGKRDKELIATPRKLNFKKIKTNGVNAHVNQ